MMKMDVVECKFLVKSRQSQLPVLANVIGEIISGEIIY